METALKRNFKIHGFLFYADIFTYNFLCLAGSFDSLFVEEGIPLTIDERDDRRNKTLGSYAVLLV